MTNEVIRVVAEQSTSWPEAFAHVGAMFALALMAWAFFWGITR
jgi:hypothetical protein